MSIKILQKKFTPFQLYSRNEPIGWGPTSYDRIIGAFKGFIQPVSGNENLTAGKNGEKATHRLYTYIDYNIKYSDKIIQNGISYFVVYAIQPLGISGTGHHKEILLGIFE